MNKIIIIIILCFSIAALIIIGCGLNWSWEHFYKAKYPVFMFSINAADVNIDYGNYSEYDLVWGKVIEDICVSHGAKLISQPREMPCFEYKGNVGRAFAMKGYRMREFISTSKMPHFIAEKADQNKVYFYLYNERFHKIMELDGARNWGHNSGSGVSDSGGIPPK